MRFYMIYEQPVEGFDGDIYYETRDAHLANSQIHTVTEATSSSKFANSYSNRVYIKTCYCKSNQ